MLTVPRMVGFPCLLGSWVIVVSSIWAYPFWMKSAHLESLVPGIVQRAFHAASQVSRLFKSLQQPFDVVTTIIPLCRAVNRGSERKGLISLMSGWGWRRWKALSFPHSLVARASLTWGGKGRLPTCRACTISHGAPCFLLEAAWKILFHLLSFSDLA